MLETEGAIHLGWVVHEGLDGSPQPFLHHASYSMQLVAWIDLKQANSIMLVSEMPEEAASASFAPFDP